MGGSSTAAAVLALAACLAVATARTVTAQPRRALLDEDWGNVTVANRCSKPVVFKAAYNFFVGIDEGHPCPNPVPGTSDELNACTTDWQTIKPGDSVDAGELPSFLWSYSAYVQGASPAVYISREASDAYLGDAGDYTSYCNEEVEGVCVWWAVPELNQDNNRLVLRCPEVDGGAPAPAAPELPIQLINNCSAAVEFKVAYSISDGASTADCVFNLWRGPDDHLCIIDWQTLEAGDEAYIADSQNPYWLYGAHIAGDPSYDLAKPPLMGAMQRSNETLACPEEDVYGSGYICEWWAPSYISGTEPNPGPVTITCDDYTATQ